jgi:hypothetical protein
MWHRWASPRSMRVEGHAPYPAERAVACRQDQSP